jgi:hypothetical protein
MLFATGHSISLIPRVEPTDNRFGEVCHSRGVGKSLVICPIAVEGSLAQIMDALSM